MDWKLQEFPETGTTQDFHEYDDKLESFTFESMDKRQVNTLSFKTDASCNVKIQVDKLK